MGLWISEIIFSFAKMPILFLPFFALYLSFIFFSCLTGMPKISSIELISFKFEFLCKY